MAFARAAREAGVGRIVYLGGMHPDRRALAAHGLPQGGRRHPAEQRRADDRAAGRVIIGSGSASFEMMRYLTERLPVMTTPSWVTNRVQPIAIRDVLRYLVGSAAMPPEVSRTFDIGGPEVLTYRKMMQRYAAVAGAPSAGDRACRGADATAVQPLGLAGHAGPGVAGATAGRLAHPRGGLLGARHRPVRTGPGPTGSSDSTGPSSWRSRRSPGRTWRRAGRPPRWPAPPAIPLPSDPDWAGGSLYRDDREVGSMLPPTWSGGCWRRSAANAAGTRGRSPGGPAVSSTASSAARACGVAGATRTGCGSTMPWTSGGSRRSTAAGCCGSARRCVRQASRGSSSRCRPTAPGVTLRQAAIFYPRGLSGHLYWWSLKPFHRFVFGPMQAGVRAEAEHRAAERPNAVPADRAN
jgi:hypothetical protein